MTDNAASREARVIIEAQRQAIEACAKVADKKSVLAREMLPHDLQQSNMAAQIASNIRALRPNAALADEAASQPREVLPRLTDAISRAACRAHYGDDNIDGISMTVDAHDYSFRQAFARMWKGVRAALHDTAPTDQAQRGEVERLFRPGKLMSLLQSGDPS